MSYFEPIPSMVDPTTPAEVPWTRVRFHAPRVDGAVFLQPQPRQALDLAAFTSEALDAAPRLLLGRPLGGLRAWARAEVARESREFLIHDWGLAREPVVVGADIAPDARWIVTGHQPQLAHPGVWLKNFVTAGLAVHGPAAGGGVGLNLIVDNDTINGSSVRVPAGHLHAPRFESLPFDDAQAVQPWEGATIQNPALFESFGDRLAERGREWGFEPLATRYWPLVVAQANRSGRLGDAFSAARHALERGWGIHNLELPLSRLCTLEPFLWFASHLLAELPRFHELYNGTLDEYRRVNRVRSRNHPVPELRAQGDWLEAPFWIWRTGEERRRRVFVRRTGHEIWLSDGERTLTSLPLSPRGEACCAVKALQGLAADGFHFRTRALTTTLFARLFLADLFVHGIGGAKYDEMTDRLITRFYGLGAPPFLTATATRHLPIPADSVVPADLNRIDERLRELAMHPELHAPRHPEAEALRAEKARLVGEQQFTAAVRRGAAPAPVSWPNGRARYARLQEITRELAAAVEPLRADLRAERALVEARLRARAVLQSREYPFCLHPESGLRALMQPFIDGSFLEPMVG